jgi:2'-5' RNA ligase
MTETTRTFVAIAIPDPLGVKLQRLQSELSPEVPGCRWTSSLPFHLTLAFLGSVPNRDLNDVFSTVASSAGLFEPFELSLEGVGTFPSATRPRVIWAGLSDPSATTLLNLRESVVTAVTRAGYPPDHQRFHPHVTLGRIKLEHAGPGDLRDLLARYQSWSGGTFTVAEVVTFASQLGRGGSIYTALDRAPIARKN